jgi:hypothetical protein
VRVLTAKIRLPGFFCIGMRDRGFITIPDIYVFGTTYQISTHHKTNEVTTIEVQQ